MALSEAAVRNAKPSEKAYKKSDGDGLYLLVQPTGGRLWRMDYRFMGKRKTLAFGSFPEVSLSDARARRDAARKQLAAGTDPSAQKKADAAASLRKTKETFATVVTDYLTRLEAGGAAERTMEKNRWLLERLSKPLSQRPIANITAAEILDVLQSVEASGRLESAQRLRAAISAVFRLAVVTLRAPMDPTYALRGATMPPKVENYSAITDPKRLGWLMNAIDQYDGWPTLRSAMLFTAFTVARPGEVRQAEWSEIDLSQRTWVIPAERQKMRRVHEVPLSDQAVTVLDGIRPFSGRGRLVFPSIRAADRPLSENGMNAALMRIGVDKTEHMPHGFRSSFSTILNARREDPEIIEMCLAHVGTDKVRRVYNRAICWPERTAMMKLWGNLLDEFQTL